MASTGATISQSGGLAGRYAAALYDLADEQNQLDHTVEQAAALARMIDDNPDFRRLLDSKLIDIKQSIAAARDVLRSQGFSPIIERTVCVVAANRRLGQLRAILAAFALLVAAKRGVVAAQVISAHPLTLPQREAVRARLIEAGYGNVDIHEQVDPGLLGGLVVKIGARLYDNTIKSRLQRLKFAMKGAA